MRHVTISFLRHSVPGHLFRRFTAPTGSENPCWAVLSLQSVIPHSMLLTFQGCSNTVQGGSPTFMPSPFSPGSNTSLWATRLPVPVSMLWNCKFGNRKKKGGKGSIGLLYSTCQALQSKDSDWNRIESMNNL